MKSRFWQPPPLRNLSFQMEHIKSHLILGNPDKIGYQQPKRAGENSTMSSVMFENLWTQNPYKFDPIIENGKKISCSTTKKDNKKSDNIFGNVQKHPDQKQTKSDYTTGNADRIACPKTKKDTRKFHDILENVRKTPDSKTTQIHHIIENADRQTTKQPIFPPHDRKQLNSTPRAQRAKPPACGGLGGAGGPR